MYVCVRACVCVYVNSPMLSVWDYTDRWLEPCSKTCNWRTWISDIFQGILTKSTQYTKTQSNICYYKYLTIYIYILYISHDIDWVRLSAFEHWHKTKGVSFVRIFGANWLGYNGTALQLVVAFCLSVCLSLSQFLSLYLYIYIYIYTKAVHTLLCLLWSKADILPGYRQSVRCDNCAHDWTINYHVSLGIVGNSTQHTHTKTLPVYTQISRY